MKRRRFPLERKQPIFRPPVSIFEAAPAQEGKRWFQRGCVGPWSWSAAPIRSTST